MPARAVLIGRKVNLMLVLSRLRDQTVMIGDDIQVTVVDVRGEKVRLGFSAPRGVSIHRKEVYDEIRTENQQAASVQPGDVPQVGGPPAVNSPAIPAPFLRAAIDEARTGLSEGGLPIGSVLVRDNQIIGRGHNRRVQRGDPMAHAEIDCLTNAGRQKTYKDTILYSTLTPCFLCSGAVIQFGIPKVIVGESVNFPGAKALLRAQGVGVVDLHDPECVQMMAAFIKAHPELWYEDIGHPSQKDEGKSPT